MRDAFIRRLTEMAGTDPRIMLLTADLGFGVIDGFAREFPRQFVNVGVAEQNMTGIATGLALEGNIVFTYSIANFPVLRCLEQVRNDACYHQANVNIVAIGGGFAYGALGFSHHATEDLAVMRALPGMTVVAPADDWEAEEATSALAAARGTCYLRLDRSSAQSGLHRERFELGTARVVREGRDLTFISTGGILPVVLSAAETLAEQRISCRVLSMHTVKPLDCASIVRAARETRAIVTVEEHGLDGGLGSAVAEVCLDLGAPPRVFRRVGLPSALVTEVGSQDYLRARYGLDHEGLVTAARDVLSSAFARTSVASVSA